jgi:hypothetical protein
MTHRWVGHDAAYFGTVIAVGLRLPPSWAAAVDRRLQGELPRTAGVDAHEDDLVVGRFAGADGPAFHRARAIVAEMVRTHAGNDGEPDRAKPR